MKAWRSVMAEMFAVRHLVFLAQFDIYFAGLDYTL